jgi:Flp pilus assembly protein TadD
VDKRKARRRAAPLTTPARRDREDESPRTTRDVPVRRAPGVVTSAALVAITLAVFAPTRRFPLVDYDDIDYIADNPHVRAGLTWSGVKWAFTTGHMANWHPLTWLSHMLDVQLFGDGAGAYHVVSLSFHVLNTLLLFGVLHRMTGALQRSAFVAALFAVHPMHVESVAWVAERKDVLSTFFWLLTMWAYSAWVRRPDWRSYALVLVCYALGLLSKPMLVTLPCVLLLMDVWPLRRPLRATLLVEKLPLFFLALTSSVVTVIAQRQGGAVVRLDLVPFPVRVANAIVAYARYVGKLVWPTDLAAMYPMSRTFPDATTFAAAASVLVAITVLAVRTFRRQPYVLVGWLWFLGTLVPVIGIVQVGIQAMADRYSYVPFIGLFVIIAWGVPDLVARLSARSSPLRSSTARSSAATLPAARLPAAHWALRIAAVATVAACAATAAHQVQYWRSSESLWTHAMQVTPDNYFAQANLAYLRWRDGRSAEAIPLFRESIRIRSDFAEVHNNLGVALAGQGELDAARAQFREAAQIDPGFVAARDNLAATEAKVRALDSGVARIAGDTVARPRDLTARNELGAALAAQGRIGEAAEQFRKAIEIDPRQPDLHFNLGAMLQRQGRVAEAADEYRTALRLNPRHQDARDALARLAGTGTSAP